MAPGGVVSLRSRFFPARKKPRGAVDLIRKDHFGGAFFVAVVATQTGTNDPATEKGAEPGVLSGQPKWPRPVCERSTVPLIIVRDREAMQRYGVRPTTWAKLCREPNFPRPIYITSKIRGRLEHELDADIQRRADARDGKESTT